jgi:dipeptidyl aminopeptidase/acylaminoacyl peptidase
MILKAMSPAYSVATEHRHHFSIDSRIQPDLDFLAEQDIGDWYLSSRTEDDRLWVIGAYSDIRPSAEYLFDRKKKTLQVLHNTRPELADAPLQPMQPIIIKSRDGLDLVSYITLPKNGADIKPRPMVVLVHGGLGVRPIRL